MVLHILQSTPIQIWILLAVLVGLGLSQTRTRTVGSTRATLLPVVFVLLSLAGVLSAFGLNAAGLVAWAVGVAVALSVGARLLPRIAATWQAASDTLQVAGSWLPLVLIVSLFAIKYAAGVSLAVQPRLAADSGFVVAFSLAYGIFSGLFATRGLQLWQIRKAAAT